MSNPIVFSGLSLDEANATVQYHGSRGAAVQVTADSNGTFTVQVDYSAAGTGFGGSNAGAAGGAGGAQSGQQKIAWGKKVSADFKAKVIGICGGLSCDPSFLMASMAFETGATFSPTLQNPRSLATGLIQFLPSTAASLGTSIAALEQMTAVAQLDFVQKYLTPFKGRMLSLSDVYMTILFPVAVGKPDSFVLFAAPSSAYEQNSGLDVNHDGQVTKGEAASKVQSMLDQGLSTKNCG
jgi:hypothetical protein